MNNTLKLVRLRKYPVPQTLYIIQESCGKYELSVVPSVTAVYEYSDGAIEVSWYNYDFQRVYVRGKTFFDVKSYMPEYGKTTWFKEN